MKTKKILALALAAVLLMGITVAGTIAYLQAESETVTNTFAPSGIAIELDESEYNAENNSLVANTEVQANDDYQFIPGRNLPKDPTVTVDATVTDVDIFLFLTVDTTNWTVPADITYDIDSKWTKLENGVYYTTWAAGEDVDFNVLVDKQIVVGTGLTENEMATIPESVSLSFHAYAIQQQGFAGKTDSEAGDAALAWAEIKVRTDGGTQLY